MPKFTIVETRRVHSLNLANPTGFDTLVTYTDEANRIHVITVPGSELAQDQIDAAIQAEHSDRTQHKGRTIET